MRLTAFLRLCGVFTWIVVSGYVLHMIISTIDVRLASRSVNASSSFFVPSTVALETSVLSEILVRLPIFSILWAGLAGGLVFCVVARVFELLSEKRV